ncbi:MAG: tetratricopeptide repeat protein [Endomicrobium sp.]|jgi:tetratricopeptide (TPR) repeat protein|nr:tetratricopeptide repeat protein [Endomicrobium sp.]
MKIERKFFIKIIIFFALLIVLFFLLFISKVNVKGNNKAVKYFNKGNFELASQTFDDELKKNPGNYVLTNNSAGVDYKLNKFDQAEVKYRVVINSTDTLKEDKFIALYDMGNVEFKKNNFEKAIDLYKGALKINPNDKDAKYNLEVSLLKLNEKNNQQNNKDDNKNNDKQKQQEQNLKKQMEENDKAQKENEKKQQEANNSSNSKDNSSSGNSSENQKKLEKEKKELDKQKQEISDKIKDLMNSKEEEKESNQKQNSSNSNKEKSQNNQPEQKNEQQELQMKKDENKDMQAAMLLNYYNEADRNANKVKNQNKKFLVDQPQEDW